MDVSFTFLTSFTNAKKNQKAPQFSKLLNGKSKSKVKNTDKENKEPNVDSEKCYNESTTAFTHFKDNDISGSIHIDNSIPGLHDYMYSSLYQEDQINYQLQMLGISNKSSITSVKSRSDSLHFSSVKSLSFDKKTFDMDEKKVDLSSPKIERNNVSDIDPVCAGLSKVTFRKKRPNNVDKNIGVSSNLNFGYDSSITEHNETEHDFKISNLSCNQVVSSTPTDKNQSVSTRLRRSINSEILKKSDSDEFQLDNCSKILPLNDNSGVEADKLSDVSARFDDSSDDTGSFFTCADSDANSSFDQTFDKLDEPLNPNPGKDVKKFESKTFKKNTVKNSISGGHVAEFGKNLKLKKLKNLIRRKERTFRKSMQLVLDDNEDDWVDVDDLNFLNDKGNPNDGVKSKTKKTNKRRKKKDSFIVSDGSVGDPDPFMFHQILAHSIKFDAREIQKAHSTKKKNAKHVIPRDDDDGVFTPFVAKKHLTFGNEDKKKVDTNCGRPKYALLGDSDISGTNDESASVINLSDKPKAIAKQLTFIPDKYTLLNGSDISNSNSSTYLPETPKSKLPKSRRKVMKPVVRKKSINRNNIRDGIPVTPDVRKKIIAFNSSFNTPDGNSENRYFTFLRSLSNVTGPLQIHPDAVKFKEKYKKLKGELSQKLFHIFNKEVFSNQLPDDMVIEWNARMRSTSGYCYHKRIVKIEDGKKEWVRVCRIVLSAKILSTPDRLRDTLVHELCHAASWLINGKSDGHGPIWKSWARKAMDRFPELPPIRRCHDYAIKTKFTYRCVKCGYSIGRHSKSLNLQRKRCGHCYGEFELILNISGKEGKLLVSPRSAKPKKLSKFAQFVKENYGKVKTENSTFKHGEIMRLLGIKFSIGKIADEKN